MNKTLYSLLLSLSTLIFATHAIADTLEDGRIWLNINAQGALPVENLNWYAEIQPRWRQEGEHLDSLMLRPAIFYKLSKQSSLWLGYAKVINHPSGAATRDENRFWQQFTYNFSALDQVSFQSRTRIEERDLESAQDQGYRLRQMLRASKPLSFNPAVAWVVWDEFFLNLNNTDWGARSGTDQNRLFLGTSWTINPQLKLEIGYLNQYTNTTTIDRVNHILSTTIGLSF